MAPPTTRAATLIFRYLCTDPGTRKHRVNRPSCSRLRCVTFLAKQSALRALHRSVLAWGSRQSSSLQALSAIATSRKESCRWLAYATRSKGSTRAPLHRLTFGRYAFVIHREKPEPPTARRTM